MCRCQGIKPRKTHNLKAQLKKWRCINTYKNEDQETVSDQDLPNELGNDLNQDT